MEVSAIASARATAASTRLPGEVGKDDFLMLMLMQLKNQDPLKPVDDTQFIAQLAQFSTLEKMQQLDERMSLLLAVEQLGQASGLIGKEVEATRSHSDEKISGTVDLVQMEQGIAWLRIGNESVKLSDVVSVAKGEDSDQ